MDEVDLQARRLIHQSFVCTGCRIDLLDLAWALGCNAAEARGCFERLAAQHVVVLEPGSGEIEMAMPFSAVARPHEVFIGAHSYWANCAWDALGILAAMGKNGRVVSSCPDCQERIELRIDDGQLTADSAMLMHLVVPARRWWDDIRFT